MLPSTRGRISGKRPSSIGTPLYREMNDLQRGLVGDESKQTKAGGVMRVTVREKRLKAGPDLHEEVERRVYCALARFADVIRVVSVHLTDVNGPRGGIDKNARVFVLLKPAEQVVAEATDVTVIAAVDRVCYRVKRLVSRTVERRNDRIGTQRVRLNGRHKEG